MKVAVARRTPRRISRLAQTLKKELSMFHAANAGSADEPLFLPLVVLGELYRGVLKSARPEINRAKVNEFLEIAAVLSPDVATADIYARIAQALEIKGTPIPENDIWIAAVALECEMPLATRDDHFRQVDTLDILWW